jgi:hypothetical protein
MSWIAEVIADSSGKWAGNGLTFATEAEATFYVDDLADRWTSVRQQRVVEVDKPVTHYWDGMDMRARPIAEKPKADSEYDQAFAKFIEREDER